VSLSRQRYVLRSASKCLFSTEPSSEIPIRLSNRNQIHGRKVVKELGLVSAGAVRTKNILVDVLAALRGVFGGSSHWYSSLVNDATSEASTKLATNAHKLGATSVVRVRFQINTTMHRLATSVQCTVLAYGTAVCDEAVATEEGAKDEIDAVVVTATATVQQEPKRQAGTA